MSTLNGPLRVGIGGPVGAGKTSLTAALCRSLRDDFSIAAITNDIYTQEDAEALQGERFAGCEQKGFEQRSEILGIGQVHD